MPKLHANERMALFVAIRRVLAWVFHRFLVRGMCDSKQLCLYMRRSRAGWISKSSATVRGSNSGGSLHPCVMVGRENGQVHDASDVKFAGQIE